MAIATRPVRYNATLDYIASRATAGAAFVISPKEPLPISRTCHDPDRMRRVYDIGLREGRRQLAEVQRFFAS